MGSPADRIETLRERIEDSGDIADADRELLRAFDDRLTLLEQTYSDHRHEKLVRHAVIMAEELDGGLLADAVDDRDAAEEIVGWINREYENEETNRDYRSALRVFAKRVADTDDGECPPAVDWVPTSTSSDYDPTPDPSRHDVESRVRLIPSVGKATPRRTRTGVRKRPAGPRWNGYTFAFRDSQVLGGR